MQKELEQIRRRFIESAGHTTQSLGEGRVIGQIFAYLYFSREPLSLDDLVEALDISKGSASMTVRQLEQWGAVRRVWIKGDRKDYYESVDTLGKIARKAMLDTLSRRMSAMNGLLEESEQLLAEHKNTRDADWKFFSKRLKRFRLFRDRAQWLWDKFIQGILLK